MSPNPNTALTDILLIHKQNQTIAIITVVAVPKIIKIRNMKECR